MKHITVELVRFYKDDFAIVVASDDTGGKEVYTGPLPSPEVGKEYDVECTETIHPKFGKQWKITHVEQTLHAAAASNALQYMLSGAIVGCGPVTAQKIYDTFGDQSIDIIRNHYERLAEIKGISLKTAERIHQGEQQVSHGAGLLSLPGITPLKAKKIAKVYGDDAEDVVRNTPYKLVFDIKGFAFKTVDAIALHIGIAKDDAQRIAGALTFILTEIGKEGHCYCGKKKLLDRAEELLNIPRQLIEDELQHEVDNGHIVLDGRSVYAKGVYDTECETAQWTTQLAKKPTRLAQAQIDTVLRNRQDLRLADEQREAVVGALTHNVFAITGGAGTGKTTVIKAIAEVYKKLCTGRVVMCAPTGKAARRMTEATGCKAMTSARLSLIKGEWPHDSLIICDEASMLDIYMAHDLMYVAQQGNNQIVFLGDVNQLPPVGAGTFFRDLLESEVIAIKRLLICHRQSGVIAENADKINRGEKLSNLVFDGEHTKFLSGNEVQHAIAAYKTAVAKYGVENVCLLLPFRQARGNVPATESANFTLRPVYNKHKPNHGCKFAEGDRVINLVNDPEQDIANGDVGTVLYSSKDENLLQVQMDSGVHVTYPHECEQQFDLAYALTIHKSQGSEYDCVIILLTSAAFIMLERNLVYTAVTRGKKEVIMMGDKKAYGIALHTQKAIQRNTKLIERMKALM